MKLRDYSKEIEQYRKLIPATLRLITDKLNERLEDMTFTKGITLETYGETTQKTKLLSHMFPGATARAAKALGIDWEYVDATGYDHVLNEITKVEDKTSLGDDDSKFAVGNNHSKAKNCIHLVQKFKISGNEFTDIFAALVDVPKLQHPDSGWDDKVTETGKNNNGFSSLYVNPIDLCHVYPIFGDTRKYRLGTKNITPQTKTLKTAYTIYERCIY